MLQRETDLIQSFQKTSFAECVDNKSSGETVRGRQCLLLKAHRKSVTGRGLHATKQIAHERRIEHNRQDPCLHTLVAEDVRDARRDDCSKSVIVQGPRGMLTTGSASEVFTGQKNLAPLEARVVQHKSRIRGAVSEESLIAEQESTEPGSLNQLEKLLRKYLIRVDMRPVERDNNPCESGELFHGLQNIPRICQATPECGGCRDCRTDKVRSAAPTLSVLEITIAC